MKNTILSIIVMLVASIPLLAQNVAQKKYELPELHTIKVITLSPSYSCRGNDQSQGYGDTALFLSEHSKQRRGVPDLLFNGACGSEDFFAPSTAGDDFSLIADLGAKVSLKEISARRAFSVKLITSYAEYSKFVKVAKVELNHTYAVLWNESDKRGLLVFKVTEYVPNEKVVLEYAVKAYQIMPNNRIQSKGFDFDKSNN